MSLYNPQLISVEEQGHKFKDRAVSPLSFNINTKRKNV